MTGIVYINGNYYSASDAKISVFDRGLLFGDSIYEVIPVYKGRLFRLDKHLKRLAYSLENTGITQPKLDWKALFKELIERNGRGDLQIYLQITRGNQGIRKHDIPSEIEPTVIAYTLHLPYPSLEEKQRGLHVRLVEDTRWLHCNIKTTAMLANILLNDEAVSAGANTALLIRDGFLTEGSSSNVFLVDSQNRICTPPLNNLCLPGVTRQVTIELIKSMNWSLQEENIPSEALFHAKEIWITSTTKEIYPVTQINNSIVGQGCGGPYWEKINIQYQQLIENNHD
ncbi:D-amino acid aminotransferase [Legionella fairfieldensis]|uniref:D-amino acid aminotransferase n=1 Tax=Legionella fairfieldensis TaxID=45064 RepID=UPI00048FCF1C|nr:D-amino acid aminotransferase [Legionella fairfieldensis]